MSYLTLVKEKYSERSSTPLTKLTQAPFVSNVSPRGDFSQNVYRYRIKDSPNWLTFIAPGLDLVDAKKCLIDKFGNKLVEVKPREKCS